ncbi:MAG: 50S ribosomal protein L17 [Clostridiales bacterium]|nr:50S ribosomal protein L17 [Clostridiales bacterium]
MPGTRKLGRPTDHRRSMLRGLVTYLLEHGRIETTVTRAKEVRAVAEKMITTAKTDSLHSKRKVLAYVTKEDVVKKLFDEIAPQYADVPGGYTRIVKTGPRRGDAAEMCIIELVESPAEKAKAAAPKKARGRGARKAAAEAKAQEKAPAKKKAKAVEEAVEEIVETVEETVEEAAEAVEETVEEVAEEAAEAVEEVEEAVEETAETAEEVTEAAEEAAEEASQE